MTWLVVALVAVALIAIGAYVMERQRSAALRRRFGPEYERALGEADGNRRAAETQLRERLRRRAAVDVRDLEPAVARPVLVPVAGAADGLRRRPRRRGRRGRGPRGSAGR